MQADYCEGPMLMGRHSSLFVFIVMWAVAYITEVIYLLRLEFQESYF